MVDARGEIVHALRAAFVDFLRPGDLVVANDAATLPASLRGEHVPSGRPVEVRLAGRRSLAPDDVRRFSAVVFGAGDYSHAHRGPAAAAAPGAGRPDSTLGPLSATVERLLGHPRLRVVALRRHAGRGLGRPRAARPADPVRARPRAAGAVGRVDVDRRAAGRVRAPVGRLRAGLAGPRGDARRGVAFATLTHAAGISSTGDDELDRRLPFDEPYRIPPATAAAIGRARARGGRVVAIGTTVVRALEHAATCDGRVRAGEGLATQRIGPATVLRVVDAILSGTHEPGTSHYELLRAFADDATLSRVDDRTGRARLPHARVRRFRPDRAPTDVRKHGSSKLGVTNAW